MAYALIDNATLTAVQRLLGQVETRGSYSTDGDIVALENIIQAILFYDDVLCVDNYKAEYSAKRKKQFDFIKFLNVAELHLDEIEAQAIKESSSLIPEISGGEFVDDTFKGFLDQLKLHILCTWDISSSLYYLTMKMLGQPDSPEFAKYGNLSAAIFSELSDSSQSSTRISTTPTLVDRYGSVVSKGYKIPGAKWPGNAGNVEGISSGLKAFISALGWTSFKSLYYMNAARYLRADVFLYPIRQAFQIKYMEKRGVYGADFTKSIIDRMAGRISEDVQGIISSNRAIAISHDLPLFSAWLIMKCGNVKNIINAALELRGDERIREARSRIKEVRLAFDAGELAGANKKTAKILAEVEKASHQLRADFGIRTSVGYSIRRLMQVYNTMSAFLGWFPLPEYDFKVKLPKVLIEKVPRQSFSALYRDVGHDLSQVWGLGEARDRLGAAVVLDKSRPVFSPKTEDPQYRNTHTEWKSPM